MFGSEILDLALGVVYVILLVSLMVTATSEVLSSWLRWRSEHLLAGLDSLLGSSAVRAELYKHPLIKGLVQPRLWTPKHMGWLSAFTFHPKGPSYIPSRTFVLALLDIVQRPHEAVAALRRDVEGRVGSMTPADAVAALNRHLETLRRDPRSGDPILADVVQRVHRIVADLEAAIGSPPSGIAPADSLRAAIPRLKDELGHNVLSDAIAALPQTLGSSTEDLQRALFTSLDEAAGDVERMRRNLETWFNHGMDRVSGWYKRKIQAVNMALGLGLAVILNIDLWRITETLWTNQALREAVVAQARQFADQPPASLAGGTPSPAGPLELSLSQPQVAGGGSVVLSIPKAKAASKPEVTVDDVQLVTVDAKHRDTDTAYQYQLTAKDVELDAFAVITASATAPGGAPGAAPVTDRTRLLVVPQAAKRFKALQTTMMATGLPVGWSCAARGADDAPVWCRQDSWWWLGSSGLAMLLGWLLTALAASLGAPFWFDALNKIITIRSAGKAPEEQPKSPKSVPKPREPGDVVVNP